MTAAELTAAADRLDGAIERLSTDTAVWDDEFPSINVYADQTSYGRIIIHPGVAKALAAWLREHSQWLEDANALAVARAINGGA
jgi:hypothetical protein